MRALDPTAAAPLSGAGSRPDGRLWKARSARALPRPPPPPLWPMPQRHSPRGRAIAPPCAAMRRHAHSDQSSERVVLLYGKMEEDEFALDLAHPLSLLHAFAIVLTTWGW